MQIFLDGIETWMEERASSKSQIPYERKKKKKAHRGKEKKRAAEGTQWL